MYLNIRGTNFIVQYVVKQMERISELLPEEYIQKLKAVSKRLSISDKEIVRRSVGAYIQKLAGMEEELELVGFGMWKDISKMSNSPNCVGELRREEWDMWG